MQLKAVISVPEAFAHPSLQESYDNAGLITGDPEWECTGIICCLDVTEEVIKEAIAKKINLIVAHHPIIFGTLKKIDTNDYVGRVLVDAIKHDIALYAIHTNIDNVLEGVSGRMATLIGIQKPQILAPKPGTLRKLFSFVPIAHVEKVRNAIFATGAGQIGNYSDCSFSVEGTGSFKAGSGTQPFVGKPGELHLEREARIEVVFPAHLEGRVVKALVEAHPYEEVAYDIVSLSNTHPGIGAGIIGELPESIEEAGFLQRLKEVFGLKMLKHTAFLGKPIKRVAVCGGAGSFLIARALSAKADVYITGDLKYHEFFGANDRMLLVDIGHYESEQFTISLLQEILAEKFPTFAVLKTAIVTNPVRYS